MTDMFSENKEKLALSDEQIHRAETLASQMTMQEGILH